MAIRQGVHTDTPRQACMGLLPWCSLQMVTTKNGGKLCQEEKIIFCTVLLTVADGKGIERTVKMPLGYAVTI